MSDTLEELEARVDALGRARMNLTERIEDLERENEELRERVATLESVVDTDPDSIAYDALTKDRKVHRIRSKLVEIADNTDGSAAMHYDDVINEFGGRPSPGHAYDLMDAAANLDGFAIDEGPKGKKRISVKTEYVNDLAVFRAANKAVSEEAI